MAGRMWNFFSNLWVWRRNTVAVEKRQNLTDIFDPYMLYIGKFQKILTWEEPVISAVSIVAVNILFWFLINFEISFFFFVFGIAVLTQIYDVWTRNGVRGSGSCADSSAQLSEQNCPEIKHYLSVVNDIYVKVKMLHSEQRGLFCFCMCVLFSTLMMISRVVSGVVISYISIMTLFIAPGIYRLLPPPVIEKVKHICSLFIIKDADYVIDHYLPEENEENMAALSLTGDTADTDSEKEDSMFNLTEFSLGNENGGNSTENQLSWSAGLTGFPSLEEESVDGGPTDFDLTSSALNKSNLKRLDVEFSDSDNDEETAGMNFQSSHFNGDSSEEEKHFVEGLEFSPSTHPKSSDEKKPKTKDSKPKEPTGIGDMIASSILQNVSSLSSAVGQKMFSALNIPTQQSATSVSDDKSSDDSDDFEIIDDEDLS